ncbi:MAG: RtcB family protein [Endomicrobia bacterium]|nr:RtcB family protein [Endomicrobiia bacterium]MCL2506946.1 RtcB family protein [Endomicrobiia bacterium]
MKHIETEGLIIKSWCKDLDEASKKQALNLAKLPFAFRHIALMADAHSGYGMPIGGILACKDVVIPNAVGVDIGCGMRAVKTNLKEIDAKTLLKITHKIKKSIPVGFEHRKTPVEILPLNKWKEKTKTPMKIVSEQYKAATFQAGTLGGGNHFIEIQKGSDGHIWFMIHSGSRNLGKQVAEYYNLQAKKLNMPNFPHVPKEADLAFIPITEKLFKEYLAEMNFCVEFALLNRKTMANIVKGIFTEEIPGCSFYDDIDIAHNYCKKEEHFKKEVWVHRKGATSAYNGQTGIIPGSQGTKSYIVKGLGNEESFMSCSHGAGRKMSRKQAIRELDFHKEKNKLDSQGIIHSITGRGQLDEAAGAYKNIEDVMQAQRDLVSIETELTPLAVVKG